MRAAPYLTLLATLALAASAASCTDPVIDEAIAKLGDEPASPGPGPNHRPNQPCVLCHQPAGTANSHFAVAGTIYDVADPKAAKGVEGVQILMVDAAGTSPRGNVFTNKSGNFFVRDTDWPDLQFPFHVKINKDGNNKLMTSHVGREPSCAGCHRDPVKGVSNDRFGAVGRVHL
ncbi:hypothetical protein [Pendulispora albinea]|uniref:Uncharacterized protein n=1 Tax=Pendulispora albinea TaxID=2741071 RepID=A0ABZ2LRC6_9BACT